MSDRRRKLSALAWLVVAVVLVRGGSGGGRDIGSFLYVAEHEPFRSYLTGAVVLAVVIGLVVGLLRWRSSVATLLSPLMSAPIALYGGYLFLHGHDSAAILVAAALAAFALAVVRVAPRSAGPKGGWPRSPGPE